MSKYVGQSLGAVHMYEYFKKKYPDSDVTYPMFKHIVSEFNKKLSDLLLEGKVFPMNHGLGNLFIARIPRTFVRRGRDGSVTMLKHINWAETAKLKREEGINRYIYYTDPYYCRWYWTKYSCSLPNKAAYKFLPTKGKGYNADRLSKLLKSDELAHTNFIEVCYNKPHQYENFVQKFGETLGST